MSLKRWNDNGFKSRKFWFAVLAVAVLFAGMAFVTHYDVSEGMFRVFTSTLEIISGLYLAGNLTSKWVSIKGPPDDDQPKPPKNPPAQ